MAKAALKLGSIECGGSGIVEEGTDLTTGCTLDPIVRGIINVQNKQIQIMKSVIDDVGAGQIPYEADCDVPVSDNGGGDGGDKGDDKGDGKDGDKESGASAIFGGTVAALAAGAAALL